VTLYEVRARGLYNSADQWSFGYKFNSTAVLNDVASAFDSAISAFWTVATHGFENLCFTDVALVDTLVYVLSTEQVVLDKKITANSKTGTSSNGSAPYGTSVTVAMSGNQDTKSDRGHMSLPTVDVGFIADGLFTATLQTHLKAILDTFFASMGALAGYSAVKINAHTNRQGDAPFTQHIVNKYSVSNKPGTANMRRRKQKATAFVTGTI
jgi:hypothetical protein